jgi:hypothetical protein
VNVREVIAADLGVESTWVVIGRFNGGWLLNDVNRFLARPHQHAEHLRGPIARRPISYRHLRTGDIVPRRLPREDCRMARIEAWAGLIENESPVERP